MNNNRAVISGFGDSRFMLAVYIANQPIMPEYQSLTQLLPMQEGNVDLIGKVCGNGWRKVFNVYAKLLYELDTSYFNFSGMAPTWQKYRDQYLLQVNSGTALIFSPPQLTFSGAYCSAPKTLHIICGRTYAKKLINEGKLTAQLLWLDEEFAVDLQQGVVICPYFDYRQLSNQKIKRLSDILSTIVKGDN